MKKEITVGQLISAAIGIAMAILAGWISLKEDMAGMKRDIKFQEVRVDKMEIENNNNYYELRNEVKSLQATLNEVKILLERKQDRR